MNFTLILYTLVEVDIIYIENCFQKFNLKIVILNFSEYLCMSMELGVHLHFPSKALAG